MALTDKNIVITPNIGQASDPKIVFSGADASTAAQNITLNVYPLNNGTISFEGSAGQLFSIANTMSGSIFSVNDVSGMPSLEIMDTGNIRLAQYGGNVGIGTDTPSSILDVKAATSIIKNTSTTGTNSAQYWVSNTGGTFYIGLDSSTGSSFGAAYGAALWHSGAYPILLATSGTERVRISSAGFVGIGTTSAVTPGYPLDIRSSGGSNGIHLSNTGTQDTGAYINATGDNEVMFSGGANYSSYSAPNFVMTAKSTAAGGVYILGDTIRFWTNSGLTAGSPFNQTERMRIDASGNVGIGAAPSAALDVARDVAAGVDLIRVINTNNGANTTKYAGIVFRGVDTVSAGKDTAYIRTYPAADNNYIHSYLSFFTRASDALAERVRIGSTGTLTINNGTIESGAAVVSSLFATTTTANISVATGLSTGTCTVGGTAATGTMTFGQSTAAQTVVIGGGATADAITKQVHLGTNGTNGSITIVKIGSNVTGANNFTLLNGVFLTKQPAPTAKAAAATLTIAELRTRIITQSLSGGTLTLPTGTLMDGGFNPNVLEVDIALDWTVINTSAGAVAVAAGTGHTIVGNASVAATSSGNFRSRRTAANTWVTYRV